MKGTRTGKWVLSSVEIALAEAFKPATVQGMVFTNSSAKSFHSMSVEIRMTQ